MFKKILFIVLSVAVGCLFIYSAYAKLSDIEPFEWTIAETQIFSFEFANILSRIIIWVEYLLGVLIIANCTLPMVKNGRIYHVVYYVAMWLLFVFSVYLLFILFNYGNNGNCGCFGNILMFTPMEAIVKNVLLMLALELMHRFHLKNNLKFQQWIYPIAAAVLALYVLKVAPPDFIYKKDKQDLENPRQLDLSYLQQKDASIKSGINMITDRFLLLCVSTHCHFCVKAAKRVNIMKKRNPDLPVYMVTKTDSANYKKFLQESQAYQIPFQINDSLDYLNALSPKEDGLPAILWVENSKVIRKSSYWNLSEEQLVAWYQHK